MKIDHLVITAADLESGASAVSKALGVPLQDGGRHPLMGTHNRLLSLGDTYLEVIAVDPLAPAPDRRRWFGLDHGDGSPRLSAWAAASDDLESAVSSAPFGLGDIHAMSRGDLEWRMAIPSSGGLPFDGVLPMMLQWTEGRAQDSLTPRGCRLQKIVLTHPRMGDIRAAWPRLSKTEGVTFQVGQRPELRADIVTPAGLRTLAGEIG